MNYPDDIQVDFTERDINHDIDPLLAKRWSPRSFKPTDLSDEDVSRLFEAARVAPSCFNEQPWRFIVSSPDSFNSFLSLLVPGNQKWAKNASLIGFVLAKKTFTNKDKENSYALFDAGAAWMSLTIQARSMGLYTHGMGGIEHDKVREQFNVDDDFEVICGFAIGVIDEASKLPEDIAKNEKVTGRKPLDEILLRNDH